MVNFLHLRCLYIIWILVYTFEVVEIGINAFIYENMIF